MKRNLDALILMTNGDVMVNGNNNSELTVGAAVTDALMAAFANETPQPTGEQKDVRFNLGMRIAHGGEQEFTVDELKIITHCCDFMYGTLIYGQISAWADGRMVAFSKDATKELVN